MRLSLFRKLALAAGVATGLICGGTTDAAANEVGAQAVPLVNGMTVDLQPLDAFFVYFD